MNFIRVSFCKTDFKRICTLAVFSISISSYWCKYIVLFREAAKTALFLVVRPLRPFTQKSSDGFSGPPRTTLQTKRRKIKISYMECWLLK